MMMTTTMDLEEDPLYFTFYVISKDVVYKDDLYMITRLPINLVCGQKIQLFIYMNN